MPITAENKSRYPKDWKAISKDIRENRAKNHCEVCGIPNYQEGWRLKDGTFYNVEAFSSSWVNPIHERELCGLVERKGPIRIVLTVAHLDHQPENCDYSNLKAMCCRCHNLYDKEHRKANAKKTRAKKKRQLSLFTQL